MRKPIPSLRPTAMAFEAMKSFVESPSSALSNAQLTEEEENPVEPAQEAEEALNSNVLTLKSVEQEQSTEVRDFGREAKPKAKARAERRYVNVLLPKELAKRLALAAVQRDTEKSSIVEEALTSYLAKR